MCFESTHVACRYEQHAARAADCGQPAVCPSPPQLQHACGTDVSTTPCINYENQSLSKELFF